MAKEIKFTTAAREELKKALTLLPMPLRLLSVLKDVM